MWSRSPLSRCQPAPAAQKAGRGSASDMNSLLRYISRRRAPLPVYSNLGLSVRLRALFICNIMLT
jgi:hypothetical protein